MNLQDYKNLKKIFSIKYNKCHKEEIVENKNLLDKILQDFEMATNTLNVKNLSETVVKSCDIDNVSENTENIGNNRGELIKTLEKEKEEAKINLDILKINEINKKIANLQIK